MLRLKASDCPAPPPDRTHPGRQLDPSDARV